MRTLSDYTLARDSRELQPLIFDADMLVYYTLARDSRELQQRYLTQ